MLKTNVGHSNFRCYLKKIISSNITAFEPGTLASLLLAHVGSVTGFLDDSIGGRIFGNFFTTRHVCVVIHAEIDIDGYGTFRHFKRVRSTRLLTNLEQHVNEMMTSFRIFNGPIFL